MTSISSIERHIEKSRINGSINKAEAGSNKVLSLGLNRRDLLRLLGVAGILSIAQQMGWDAQALAQAAQVPPEDIELLLEEIAILVGTTKVLSKKEAEEVLAGTRAVAKEAKALDLLTATLIQRGFKSDPALIGGVSFEVRLLIPPELRKQFVIPFFKDEVSPIPEAATVGCVGGVAAAIHSFDEPTRRAVEEARRQRPPLKDKERVKAAIRAVNPERFLKQITTLEVMNGEIIESNLFDKIFRPKR